MPNPASQEQRRNIARALRRLPATKTLTDLDEGHHEVDVQEMQPLVIQNCRSCEIQVSGHVTKLTISSCRDVVISLAEGTKVQTRMLLVLRSTGLEIRTGTAVDHLRTELSHSCTIDFARVTPGMFTSHNYRSFNIELRLNTSDEENQQSHLISCDPQRKDNTLIASFGDNGNFRAVHGVPNSHGTSLENAQPGLTEALNVDVATEVIDDFATCGLYTIIAPAANSTSVPLAEYGRASRGK